MRGQGGRNRRRQDREACGTTDKKVCFFSLMHQKAEAWRTGLEVLDRTGPDRTRLDRTGPDRMVTWLSLLFSRASWYLGSSVVMVNLSLKMYKSRAKDLHRSGCNELLRPDILTALYQSTAGSKWKYREQYERAKDKFTSVLETPEYEAHKRSKKITDVRFYSSRRLAFLTGDVR
ncbi:unnamed protein product [Menidia menidia]|uniref:(Atlantic silverside) hypothetical protein n=1 Tax=Menidia menidia TaxID=238744 RepID=A0A8S4A9M0_9TELE|nr:unnamed protein product [Menidia menidia]